MFMTSEETFRRPLYYLVFEISITILPLPYLAWMKIHFVWRRIPLPKRYWTGSVMNYDYWFHFWHRKFRDQTKSLIIIRIEIRNRIFSSINFASRISNNKLSEKCTLSSVSSHPFVASQRRFISTLSFEHISTQNPLFIARERMTVERLPTCFCCNTVLPSRR